MNATTCVYCERDQGDMLALQTHLRRDHGPFDVPEEGPECPYWADGKHAFEVVHGNLAPDNKQCECGAIVKPRGR